MRKGHIYAAVGVAAALVGLPFLASGVGRSQLQDTSVPQRESLVPMVPHQTVLVFFPHPDDEVSVAGTLIGLTDQGHNVNLVYLTHGENGTAPGIDSPTKLARLRTAEVRKAAAVIGAKGVRFLDYTDGGLEGAGLAPVEASAARMIAETKPDIVITYDSKVGLYGHADHRMVGLAMETLFKARAGKPGFSPKHLFEVTLSAKQIALAKKVSPFFREHYPTGNGAGLPSPDLSVSTRRYFKRVMQVVDCHKTQKWMLKQFFPFEDYVPSLIYSRIFDREYFHPVV